MKLIPRTVKNLIIEKLYPNKVCLLFGARRVGKTVLIKEIYNDFAGKKLILNGEDNVTLQLLAERSIANYKRLLKNIELLIIDEAQNIPEIGKKLKLIVDEIDGIKIIATGSSGFDLLNVSGEPLTGRCFTFYLYPIAQLELSVKENLLETNKNLEERLIYGSYPEILHYDDLYDKKSYLLDLINSYLLKDILIIDGIRNSSKMYDLLKLIALQIGHEVSYDELGNQLNMSKNTISKYLDLLSKVFVIFNIRGFSRNLRKEISKKSRWYFYDNGVRNALISDFNPLSIRKDMGVLWENYIVSERIKYQAYNKIISNNYFWRTYQQQEIDWIEEIEGRLFAYEMKWGKNNKIKIPSAWADTYSNTKFKVISRDNYLDWIT